MGTQQTTIHVLKHWKLSFRWGNGSIKLRLSYDDKNTMYFNLNGKSSQKKSYIMKKQFRYYKEALAENIYALKACNLYVN
jgi:hypothetical protein